MVSLIGSFSDVAAIRAGMMNGTLDDGLPSASRTRPNGCESSSVNVFLSTGASFAVWAASSRPSGSRFDQRLSDSTASSAVTAAPSWNLRPSRSANDHFRPLFVDAYLSTICGLMARCSSVPKRVS